MTSKHLALSHSYVKEKSVYTESILGQYPISSMGSQVPASCGEATALRVLHDSASLLTGLEMVHNIIEKARPGHAYLPFIMWFR